MKSRRSAPVRLKSLSQPATLALPKTLDDLWLDAHVLSSAQRASALDALLAKATYAGRELPVADVVLLEWLAGPGLAEWDRLSPQDLALQVNPRVEIVERLVRHHGANPNVGVWAASPVMGIGPVVWAERRLAQSTPGDALVGSRKRALSASWVNTLPLALWKKPPGFVECLARLGATAWPDVDAGIAPETSEERQERLSQRCAAAQFAQMTVLWNDWGRERLDICLALPLPPPTFEVPAEAQARLLVAWMETLVEGIGRNAMAVLGWQETHTPGLRHALALWAQRAQGDTPLARAHQHALEEIEALVSSPNTGVEVLAELVHQVRLEHRLGQGLPTHPAPARPRF